MLQIQTSQRLLISEILLNCTSRLKLYEIFKICHLFFSNFCVQFDVELWPIISAEIWGVSNWKPVLKKNVPQRLNEIIGQSRTKYVGSFRKIKAKRRKKSFLKPRLCNFLNKGWTNLGLYSHFTAKSRDIHIECSKQFK